MSTPAAGGQPELTGQVMFYRRPEPLSLEKHRDLGVKQIRLLTNNPRKIVGLEGYGLTVVERVPLKVPHGAANENYLKTKKEKLGHLL